ncbi:MAG TPA: hypothetical protein VIK31_02110 [Propionibacteriaceae bacterium]
MNAPVDDPALGALLAALLAVVLGALLAALLAAGDGVAPELHALSTIAAVATADRRLVLRCIRPPPIPTPDRVLVAGRGT